MGVNARECSMKYCIIAYTTEDGTVQGSLFI